MIFRKKKNPRPCRFITVGIVIFNQPSAILQKCEICDKRRVIWRGRNKADLKMHRDLTLNCPFRYLIIKSWLDFGELPQSENGDPFLELRFKPQQKGNKYE